MLCHIVEPYTLPKRVCRHRSTALLHDRRISRKPPREVSDWELDEVGGCLSRHLPGGWVSAYLFDSGNFLAKSTGVWIDPCRLSVHN